jgi:hypothetical protein
MSPDLFQQIDPPAVWVTVAKLDSPCDDTRLVTIRIQEAGRRSVSVSQSVTRYAPEESIFLAVSKLINRLSILQVPLDRHVLSEALDQSIRTWVDPF